MNGIKFPCLLGCFFSLTLISVRCEQRNRYIVFPDMYSHNNMVRCKHPQYAPTPTRYRAAISTWSKRPTTPSSTIEHTLQQILINLYHLFYYMQCAADRVSQVIIWCRIEYKAIDGVEYLVDVTYIRGNYELLCVPYRKLYKCCRF